MILEVASSGVVWQIVGITFALSVFSQLFQWFTRTGLTGGSDLQERSQFLQEEMKNAQGDPESMAKLQQEYADILKTISKKQLVPMLIRSVVFIGIFALIGSVYGKYDSIIWGMDWYLVYFICSMLFSIVLGFARKKLRRRLYPDEEHAQSDKIRATSSNLLMNRSPQPEPNFTPKSASAGNSQASWKSRANTESSNWKNRLDDN